MSWDMLRYHCECCGPLCICIQCILVRFLGVLLIPWFILHFFKVI